MTQEPNDLHHDAVVVDTHNDLLMLVSRRPKKQQASYFREHWLPQLRAGGVDVQVLPIYIDDEFRPEGALRQTLRMIEAGHTAIEANSDAVVLCLTGAEIDAAVESGRIACVLALEGCEGIGVHVELLEVMARLGVRMPAVEAVGDGAGRQGDGRADAEGGRADQARFHRRVRERQHEQRIGEHRAVGADVRQALRGPQQLEVAVVPERRWPLCRHAASPVGREKPT